MNIWTFFDLLAPACLVCGLAVTRRGLLCRGCRSDLPPIPRACRQCALPLTPSAGSDKGMPTSLPASSPAGNACDEVQVRDRSRHAIDRCATCQAGTSPLNRVVAATAYAFPVDALVRQLKFAGRLPVAGVLGNLLLDTALALPPGERPQALVPVPLHPARLRQRGYNQAERIAKPLSHALGIPLRTRELQRTRDTSAQSGHDLRERQMNLADAFAVVAPLPAHVAIVDDVMTSGSTLRAVAGTLAEAGVQRIDAWVVARTL